VISLLSRASLRYLTRHPAQLVLAILGVAVGVAVVVGIDTAAASARRSFELATRAISGDATHVVRGTPSVPESVYTALALKPHRPPAAPIVQRSLALVEPRSRTLDLLGVDPFAEGPFRSYTSGGAGFDGAALLRGDGAWLSASTASELGVGLGEELVFLVGSQRRSLRLAGLVEPSTELARSALSDVVLVDIATAQSLLGTRGELSRIDLVLPTDPTALAESTARLARLLPESCVIEPASRRSETLAGMTRAFDINLRALGFLALLVGVFLVYNTMTFAVVQRRPLWGTLRSIGATRGELFRRVCAEALAIGLTGTVLGLGLGLLLAQALVKLVTQTINDLYYVVSVRELSLEPAVFAEAAALGIGATLLGALFPALDAMRTAPRAILDRAAGEARLRSRIGVLALAGFLAGALSILLLRASGDNLPLGFAALFLMLFSAALLVPGATSLACRVVAPLAGLAAGSLGRIATRGITSHLARSSVAIAALAIALSATAGMGILVDSFRATVVKWLDTTLVADVYISSPSTFSNRESAVLSAQLVERMSRDSRVIGTTSFRDIDLELAAGDKVFATAAALHPKSRDAYRFLEGDPAVIWPAFTTRDTLIVSESLARHRSLSPGSTLEVRTREGVRPFEVLGVFRDYSSDQGWAMLARETWLRNWGDERISALGLFLAPGADVDATIASLRATVPLGEIVKVRSGTELEAASMEIFDRTFSVTRVLRLLAGVVAILGVVGALLAMELEREREMGVLRAIGLSPSGLKRVVLGQTGLLGALAGLFAVPIGIAVALVLILVINARSFGWTLDIQISPRVLLETFALALGSALIAGAYPAWRMARLSPAQTLRGE
jgi:putative ABC transport system permease protein